MGVHKLAVMQREQLWRCTLHLLRAILSMYILRGECENVSSTSLFNSSWDSFTFKPRYTLVQSCVSDVF